MGRNWTITIGINGYRNLQRLHYAKRDAEALRDFFQQELQIATAYHFTDDSEPIPQDYGAALDSFPSYATLRRFLRVRFEEPFLRPGDNLWFFFAGHGKRHEDQDYLLPLDADPGDDTEKSTWIPLRYVTDRLRRSGADNIVMLIDACRSGTGQRDGTGFGQEKQQGVITLFACSPWEASYEVDELQQGAFTHALLEGFQLEGEGNCATVERLYARLQRRVPQLTQQYKRVLQTPYGVIEPPTKYHLILLPRKANLSDVITLKNDALHAEVRQDFKLAKQLWIRVLASSSADADAIEGIERLARIPATPSLPDLIVTPPPEVSGQRTVMPVRPTNPTFNFEVVTITGVEKGLLGMGTRKVTLERRRGEAPYRVEPLSHDMELELVAISGGAFQMGTPECDKYNDEQPQHLVTVKSFWISKHPITQAQWKAVALLPRINRSLELSPSHFQGEDRPVEQISWYDAVEFCDRLSKKVDCEYSLPSEAQWEYACRANTSTQFCFGETIRPELANYDAGCCCASEDSETLRGQTTAVMSFSANAFGLFDMHGNVWEWCNDYWHENYSNAPDDGNAWREEGDFRLRVLRGGSWNCPSNLCRSANRGQYNSAHKTGDVGFRVVCKVEPKSCSNHSPLL